MGRTCERGWRNRAHGDGSRDDARRCVSGRPTTSPAGWLGGRRAQGGRSARPGARSGGAAATSEVVEETPHPLGSRSTIAASEPVGHSPTTWRAAGGRRDRWTPPSRLSTLQGGSYVRNRNRCRHRMAGHRGIASRRRDRLGHHGIRVELVRDWLRRCPARLRRSRHEPRPRPITNPEPTGLGNSTVAHSAPRAWPMSSM